MFEDLTQKLDGVFRRLRGETRLSEANVTEALAEVRGALLEADVQLEVAKGFVDRVRERALGQAVLQSLQPGQQVVKIVHEELVSLLGGTTAGLALNGQPAVVLLCGLQGSGKTTFAAKLARHLQRKGMKPLLVAADIARPAAVEQLVILGAEIGVPVATPDGERDVPKIVARGRDRARDGLHDVLIVDTAGRLHIDAPLMDELDAIRKAVPPSETLLVVDAMTGQEAVAVGQAFDARLDLSGVVLTKLDGDARGGAALSLRQALGKPIKFVGVGERLDDLEPFHPDRMAQRILGMGDVLTLVEKAQEAITVEQAADLERKARKATFTFEDFLGQLQSVRKMGPVEKWMGLVPGMKNAVAPGAIEPRQIDRVQGIVHAMTRQERRNPNLIDGSRRRRIARGSGTSVQEVNLLLKQFDSMKKMMRLVATNPKAAARSLPAARGPARYGAKRRGR